MGTPELLIILLIVLVLFGAKQLPRLGAGLGGFVKNFRGSIDNEENEDEDEDEEVVDIEEDKEASPKKTIKAATAKKAKSSSSDEA